MDKFKQQAKALLEASISMRDYTYAAFEEWLIDTERNHSDCPEWLEIVESCGIDMAFVKANSFDVFVHFNTLLK